MKFTERHLLKFSGLLMLAAIAALVISAALVSVPTLSKWSGISETYVTYVVAGICFFIAIFASRTVRKLTEVGGKND